MHLSQLLNGLCYEIVGNADIDIESLSCNTSTVKPNCMFFCLKGEKTDGHDLFRKFIGDGATAVVCQHRLNTEVTQIIVEDSRATMSEVAKRFYNNAVDKLKVVCVVGTNGKTSTTYLLDAIFSGAGFNTGVIGSNGVFINGHRYDCALTTPDPIEMHGWFYQMYLNKVQFVFMEMSAHAIYYKKCQGLTAEATVFTNFSQDHLDFFGDMENYGRVKKSFFSKQFTKAAVVNIDDEMGRSISQVDMPVITYGFHNNADATASQLELKDDGISFLVKAFDETNSALISCQLCGEFNMYNCLAAIATARLYGISIDSIAKSLKSVESIDGRNQTVMRSDGARIVIDFAHTPDGIRNILGYLKSISQGKLIVVFGCGGNRDKFKRPLMAQAVDQFADFAVVTNDNPRFETPVAIVSDITPHLTCASKVILNRSQATEFALSIASAKDTVAILGKGAERYQEIKGKKFPYSDLDVVQKLLNNFEEKK